MATLFTSVRNVTSEVNFEDFVSLGEGQDFSKDTKEAITNGRVLSLNRSITDEQIEYLLSNDSTFTKNFAQLPNLNINLEAFSRITDESVVKLAKLCTHLSKISLKSCTALTDKAIIAIAENCPDLEEIDLSWCNISQRSLFALAKHCKKLTKVDVRSCYITDESVIELVTKCKELTKLRLPWCKSLTDKAIHAIAENCPNLTEFDIRGCEKVTTKSTLKIAKACKRLKTIHLKRAYNAISDESLTVLAENNPLLEKVNLRGCYKKDSLKDYENLSSTGIIELAANCHKIKTLDLSWQDNLQDEALLALAKNCPDLEFLDISGCAQITDEAIYELVKTCNNMKKLILFKNVNISTKSIAALKDKGCVVLEY